MQRSRVESGTPETAAARRWHDFSGYELDRFLEFVGAFLSETEQALGVPGAAREMKILLPLMRSHLRGQTETPSSLIAASGLPRGTAHRMIEGLAAEGLITRRARTRTGKTFTLHPSPKLIGMWLDYVRRLRALFGTTVAGEAGEGYFFGASYMAGASIPPLPVLPDKLALSDGLRILLHADPTFLAMQKLKQQFEVHFGTRIEVRALSLDRLHTEILKNAERATSRFDLITCDVCWMAELIAKGVLHPMERLSGPPEGDMADFHPVALATARAGDRLYGLPVQTTPELLIHRTDLLSARGIAPPETLEELLAAARELHDPDAGLSGICWNGARGTPVGTTFMMLMADFGQPVLDLPREAGGFTNHSLDPAACRPMLDQAAALEAAEFLLELLAVSPDNVLQMSWFERAKCYSEGRAAMAYCYTQIMPMFLGDPESPAYGRTGFAPHPARERAVRLAPLGGWNLCIPANLPEGRREAARQAVRTMTSPMATKLYIENGSMVSSRFSVCDDPAVAHGRPIIPVVDRMARSDRLQSWPRPAVPQLNDLVRVLGEEVHAILLRNKRPAAGLRDAQARAEALMARGGARRSA